MRRMLFGELRNPWWHAPTMFWSGERSRDAHLWREHLRNRERMHAEIISMGVRDVPWSSRRRLLGVILTCVTFALWVVAGVASLVLLAIGGRATRCLVAAYYLVSTLYKTPMNARMLRYAAELEVGEMNGWRLIVKATNVDCGARNHLFCSHPHVLYCAGVSLNLILSAKGLASVRATHIRLFVHSLLASAFPIVKDWVRALGFLPCARETMRDVLERGENGCVVPGGVREVVYAGRCDVERLYLKNVYGFVKLAMRTGTPLVPVYTFGESLRRVLYTGPHTTAFAW